MSSKSSFKINKSIDFGELLKLITKIDDILRRPEKFTLNKVFQLRGKRFEKLVEELNEAMYEQIFNDYKSNVVPDFEICHQLFEPYLTAEKYIVELGPKDHLTFDHRPTWQGIIQELRSKKYIEEDNHYYFKHSVLERKLSSFDAGNTRITTDTIFDQLNGELLHKEESYFHIDKAWYKIDPSFIIDLNNQCMTMLKDCWDDKFIKRKFDITEDEWVFNKSYLNEAGVVVLDTITPENIECCDVLFHKQDEIILMHVKKGFDNSIRDLASQVKISAKRIWETIYSDYSYLSKVDTMAKTFTKKDLLRNLIAGQTFPPKGVTGLFKQNPRPNVIFCLAFVDTAKKYRSLFSEINKFSSNIAKYSLIELAGDLRNMGFKFKVVQIENNNSTQQTNFN